MACLIPQVAPCIVVAVNELDSVEIARTAAI